MAVLRQNLQAVDLLRGVQWITQYLWFLPSDPIFAKALSRGSLLSTLAGLYAATKEPAGSAANVVDTRKPAVDNEESLTVQREMESAPFSAVQICMRSVLEALWERLGSLPEASIGQPFQHLASSLKEESRVPPRLMQLCCPLLDRACLALQVRPYLLSI